jgi:hypothetical protein
MIGFSLDLSMFLIVSQIISLGGEILVRVETNDLVNPMSEYNMKGGELNNDITPCAIKLKAQLSLREIIEDVQAIEKYFKITTDAVEEAKQQLQLRQQEIDNEYLTLGSEGSKRLLSASTPSTSQGGGGGVPVPGSVSAPLVVPLPPNPSPSPSVASSSAAQLPSNPLSTPTKMNPSERRNTIK